MQASAIPMACAAECCRPTARSCQLPSRGNTHPLYYGASRSLDGVALPSFTRRALWCLKAADLRQNTWRPRASESFCLGQELISHRQHPPITAPRSVDPGPCARASRRSCSFLSRVCWSPNRAFPLTAVVASLPTPIRSFASYEEACRFPNTDGTPIDTVSNF
jgi:hypothetical protein